MTTNHHTIIQLTEATDLVATQLKALLNYLTLAPCESFDIERLRTIVESPHTALFVAQGEEGEILGTLTVAHLLLPTSEKLWIEDVVVSPAARGYGIGRELVVGALEWGRMHYPSATIYLTSNPSRTAARALYRSLGFEEYDTGVFRFFQK